MSTGVESRFRIPMLDLRAEHAALREEIECGLREVLDSGRFVLGPQGEAFEREVTDFLGTAHAVGCGSGTDALLLALRALGIGPGHEVITTALSFAATAEAILHAGAVPVFVDVEEESFNLDPARVEAAITPATRALLPVHLFGRPAAMPALQAIARQHGLVLVEDCAQAFGARLAGRAVGTLGDAGCFSFFPSKNLGGVGDGGMVVVPSASVAQSLRELRNHGAVRRGEHRSVGYNSRLDELQAVVLRVKLRHIDERNAARRRIAREYGAALAGIPGLRGPADAEGHVYHQYTIRVEARDRVVAALDAAGIESAIHYPRPLPAQPAFAGCTHGPLPACESIARSCLSLPIHPGLGLAQVKQVAAAVRAALGR